MTTRVRPRILTLHDAELDLGQRVVHHRDRDVALTALEANLLAYLAERPRRDVARAELLANVWGYASGARTRTVDSLIHRLRDKLGEPSGEPRHLLTVRGGYRLVPSPPAGQEALCASLAETLGAEAHVTLVGPARAGKTDVARYLAYQLEGFWLQLEDGDSVRSALRREDLEDTDGFEAGGLWVVDGVDRLDPDDCALLVRAAARGALLVTSRRPTGAPGEQVVTVTPSRPAPASARRGGDVPPVSDRDPLSAEQRAVLCAAATFRGAFVRDGVGAIAGRDVEEHLDVLLARGFLAEHGPEHLVVPPPIRALVPAVAADLGAAERHRRFVAGRARRHGWDPHRLRPELADLLAAYEATATRLAAGDRGCAADLVDVACAVQRVHQLDWERAGGPAFAERALALVDDPRSWAAVADWEHGRNHPADAWRCAERAQALATTLAERAEVDRVVGTLEFWRGRATEAIVPLERAAAASVTLGDLAAAAVARAMLAVVRSELDDIDGADREMAAAYAAVPDPTPYVRSRLDVIAANLDRRAGREGRAARILAQVVARCAELDDSGRLLDAELVLTDVLLCLGDFEAAARVIHDATARVGQSGTIKFQMCMLNNRVELHLATGQAQLAVLASRDACLLVRHLHHRGVRLSCTGLLGLALLLAGELDEALEVLAATVAHARGDDGARHTATLAVARARAGDREAAADLLAAAERAAVLPSTRRWVDWCRTAVRPTDTLLEPGAGVYEAIGRRLCGR